MCKSQKVKGVTMRNLRGTILYMEANVLQDIHICISVPLIQIKCLFDKVFTMSLYCKDMVETYYITGVQKQMFYKIGVLKNFCKIHGKAPMLEALFNKVPHVLSYDLCGTFKNIYFLITPQNQTTLLCKQISKVT